MRAVCAPCSFPNVRTASHPRSVGSVVRTIPVALFGLIGLADAPSLRAQSPPDADRTIRTTPQGRYPAGALKRLFLGGGHRELWALPVDAVLLDLSTFAGGLTPLRVGGGLQTRSLRFQGADGQVWNFRSIDKDATRSLDPELRATIAADVMQDRISALLPLSALVVAPLLEAAGVLHSDPTLVVLPDDPALGEFREEFAGMLGWIEVRPDEGADGTAGFAGSERVLGSARLLDRIEGRPEEDVDARAFLRARLMDVFVGDWDRHPDQWRWAGFDDGDGVRFLPIPRDRDWALSRLDGLVGRVSWAFWPHYVGFQRDFPRPFRATWSARALDRRFLSALTRADFEDEAAFLQSALTDQVIASAVQRLPEGYWERVGVELVEALRWRRDDLQRFATDWYLELAGWVDVHTTDDDEHARVVWHSDGRLSVQVDAVEDASPRRVFERAFHPEETREVRLYMHGGDDSVSLDGTPGPVRVRVIGGGGDDTYQGTTPDLPVSVYDHRGDNHVDPGLDVPFDPEPFDEPFDPAETTHQAPFRDWGSRWLPLPVAGYDPDLGFHVGFGGIRTGYGFRSYPYEDRLHLSASAGTGVGQMRASLSYDAPLGSGGLRAYVDASASGAEVRRFHGVGNESDASGPAAFYEATRSEVVARIHVGAQWGPGRTVRLGPVFTRSAPRDLSGTLADSLQPYGFATYARAGLSGAFAWQALEGRIHPTGGWSFSAEGLVAPAWLDTRAWFARAHATVTGVGDLPGALGPTVMARVGGAVTGGDPPFQELAYLGGPTSLRGYRTHRFAGDQSLYLRGELRWRLGRLRILLPEDVGVFLLADAGRVFVEDEPSERWHRAFGGGVWVSLMDAVSLDLSLARSDEGTFFYAMSGFNLGS